MISLKKLPNSPGVYIFKNKNNNYLYIGKAGNIRKRVKQYFDMKTHSPFLKFILKEVNKIDFKQTNSEIEAIILESELIRNYKPKYNIMLKDDKQYFYVLITKEEFPRIFLTHQIQKQNSGHYLGPFVDGSALKTTLRILRKIFPYCTCKKTHNNLCLNYYIEKCLGFCCLKNPEKILFINRKQYQNNIRAIKEILSGRRESLIEKLKEKFNKLVTKQEFDKAINLGREIEKLEKVFANAKVIHDYMSLNFDANNLEILIKLKEFFYLSKIPNRIEGYDISNIQGKNATGAMAVFENGVPAKDKYRKFKIKFNNKPNDIAMLKEVLFRRFKHREWKYPDLILIDGGKAQLNAGNEILAGFGIKTNLISLAKLGGKIYSSNLERPILIKKIPPKISNFIKYIDSEAHNFAINYYRKIHRKVLKS